MDKLKDLEKYLSARFFPRERREQIDELFKEIETLRLDNTYLQQRLQREVESK